MGWNLLALLVILGIGVPILNMVYQGFVNSSNGSWSNWTTSNATYGTPTGTYTVNTSVPSTFELGVFQFIPWLCALMAVIFIVLLVSGRYRDKQQPLM
jgi:hypothetical protein